LIADGRHGSPYTIYIFFLLSSSFPRVFYFLGPTFSPARDDVEMRLACRAGSLHFFVARWVLPSPNDDDANIRGLGDRVRPMGK
jgi:hypothetical protein